MAINPDNLFAGLAGGLRRTLGLEPPATPAEAQAQYEAAEEMPLTDEEIDRVVGHACSGKADRPAVSTGDRDADETDCSAIEEDMLVLNRNAGEQDPETEAKLRELRRKALEKKRAQKRHSDQDGEAGG